MRYFENEYLAQALETIDKKKRFNHNDVRNVEVTSDSSDFSAYHGHLTSLIDISPYKFNQLENGKKEWVHVVRMQTLLSLLPYTI